MSENTLPDVPELGTIEPTMSTLSALFPSTRRALLAALLMEPARQFYLRELIRLVGRGQGSVQRELRNLVEAGILVRQTQAGRAYFRANVDCPVFPELRALIMKTAGLCTTLREALLPLKDRIRVAFIYGSVARHEENSHSDVDLAVIGDASFRSVIGAIGARQIEIGREINPVVYSVEEFRERANSRDHFVTELLDDNKLFVMGGSDDLTTVVGQSLVASAQDQPAGDEQSAQAD